MKKISGIFTLAAVALTAVCLMTGCDATPTGSDGDNPPGRPHNPSPGDNAAACDTILTLSWECSDPDGDDLEFAVYIEPEGKLGKSYLSPDMSLVLEDTLETATDYSWHVTAYDGGHQTASPDWSFTTCADTELPPEQPGDPVPLHQSTGQATNLNLSWTCTDPNLGDTLTYNVHFGTASSPPLVSGGQTGNSYDPGILETGTTYYWRIVAYDESDQSTSGPEWSFTTTSGSSGEGVFAILVAGRTLFWNSSFLTTMDALSARFDSSYAPCDPIHALNPGAVSCNEYTLEWESAIDLYNYSRTLPPFDFIDYGEEYTFNIEASLEVPALTKSIDFPDCGPYVTIPENYSTVSKSGFDVSWQGYSCGGQVRLIIIEYTGDTTSIDLMTENDGDYTFTQQELSSISTLHTNCSLIMILQNSGTIDAPGYDPRSYIWGRTINTTMIYFIN